MKIFGYELPKLLIVIFILALFLRIYNLGIFPLGFHVDEAKVAWEAISIMKTGRDDHGNLLALYYNSFGDYRPTGIFYTAIPFLFLFGRTIFAVRFSSALFGALTVFPIYFISLIVTKNKRVSLFSSLILTIIPWSITTSRATSEVVISCFLILTSMATIQKKPTISFFLLILSFFFYHSARVMGPLLMLSWIIYLIHDHKINISKKLFIGFFLSSFISLILLLSPTGLSRYNQVKLTSPNIRDIVIQYTSYFDPNFLIGDIAKPFRYITANVGIVSLPLFVLFLLGIYLIAKKNQNRILLILFALGPIPASLTLEDSPNLHRSFFMLPFLVIITAIGLTWLWEKHRNIGKIFIFFILVSFVSFVVNYLDVNENFAFQYRDPQTRIMAIYLSQVKNNYNKIYITNDPDSPYPWYAFFNNLDPKIINSDLEKQVDGKWQYENIVWDNTRCPRAKAFEDAVNDKSLTKIMVIENGMCTVDPIKGHTEAKVIKEFTYDDKVNYRVWEYIPTRI